MAAVTNTVQGLNSVIDLLKNILDTVKDDNKTVQPRDVSSVSRTTANNKNNNIQDLSALNSISKNIHSNAKTYSDVIQTITSKEVISGIRNLAILKTLGFVNAFSGALGIIVEAFNKIDNLKVNKKKIDKFKTVAEHISESLKTITASLYGLAGLIVVAAGIGILVPVAWPQILIGFAAISATLMGIMMLSLLCAGIVSLISKLSKSSNKTNSSKEIESIFGNNSSVFKDVSMLILSMAGIILVSALVGLLAEVAYKQILIGFAAIVTVLTVTLFIVRFASNVATLDNFKCILSTVLIMYALAGLVLVSALIGDFAIKNADAIIKGLIILGGMLIAVTLLMLAINFMVKKVDSRTLTRSITTIGLIILSLFALAGLVLAIVGVSKILAKTPNKDIWNTLGLMAGILGTMIVIAGLIGGFKSLGSAIAIGAGVILLLTFAVGRIVKLIDKMIDISIKIKKAKNELGDDVFKGLGEIGLQIGWAFTTISAGLALAIVPIALISPFIGKMKESINLISNFLDMLSKFTFNGNKMYTVIFDKNGKPVKGIEIDIVKTSTNIASAFGKFVTIMTNEFKNLSLVGLLKMELAFTPISKMMNPVAKFVEILKTFSAEDGLMKLCTIDFDDKGNPKPTQTISLNLTSVAMNISNAFSKFAEELAKGFENIDVDRKMKREANRLSAMMNPVAKFVETISKIEIDEQVTKVTVIGSDGKKITLNNPLSTISGISTLIKEFSNMFGDEKSGGLLASLSGLVDSNNFENRLDAMSGFINSIANSVTSLEKITVKTPVKDNIWEAINKVKVYNGKTVLEQHSNDIDIFVESWEKLDKVIFKKEKDNIKALERYTIAVNKLSKEFKDVAESMNVIANTKLDILNDTKQNNKDTKANYARQNGVNSQQSTTVTTVNDIATQIDATNIADAIKSGLSGATVRFSFTDSMEDFIGEMALS